MIGGSSADLLIYQQEVAGVQLVLREPAAVSQ